MSAIHYKFSSSNEYKNVTFDGLSISLFDLKKAIMEKQKLKSTELDLHITNAQTLQVYKDESILIPKNTAVLVRRIPLGPIRDSKVYVVKRKDTTVSTASTATKTYQWSPIFLSHMDQSMCDKSNTVDKKKSGLIEMMKENESAPKLSLDELKKTSNLAEANASEEDKIKAAIAQSTNEYDPANFVKPPRYGSYKYNTNSSVPTAQIRCYRCNQQGHYSGQCPIPKSESLKQHHHATGIPRSHMIEVNKDSKGAMLTSDGKYVVPVMDKKGYEIGKKERPPFVPVPAPVTTQEDDEEEPIPDELICLLCKDLLVDAVVIPCCGNSYCDECIRNALLESESHQCPTCKKSNISPDSLIANKFLRQAVNKFRNDTGIAKKRSNAPVWPRPAPSEISRVKPSQPVKVTYGPPHTTNIPEHIASSGGYKVKAVTEQVVPVKVYPLAKRTPETGGGSPRDPNQPIRIRLAKADKPEVSSSQSTPSEPNLQSTPADSNSSLKSSSTLSDSYTFNSTPESGEQKPRANVVEPLPPGLSPPTAKVVRPLLNEASKPTEAPPSLQLSGIEPLNPPAQTTAPEAPVKVDELQNITVPVDSGASGEPEMKGVEAETSPREAATVNPDDRTEDPIPVADVPIEGEDAVAIETTSSASAIVRVTPILPPGEESVVSSQTLEHEFDASEVSASDAESTASQRRDTSAVIPTLTVPSSLPSAIVSSLPPTSVLLTRPSIAPVNQPPPVAVRPPLPAHLLPGLLPGMPPIPPSVSAPGVNLFQHPPPPFPPLFSLPPGRFTQPPPGFPPHPTNLPPPPSAMTIPSLAKTSSSVSLPPPPGLETAPIPTIRCTPIEQHSSRRDRYSPRKSERSPRKRTERRSNKSKLDIMSDEFAEKLKKRPVRRRRERSKSKSYSSGSYSESSSTYSSSRSSSSYTSSGSSWSSSSYSRSRSPSPRKKRREKRNKQRSAKNRRRKSASWSDRSTSRDKVRNGRSYSRRKEGRKRKEQSPSKRKKRDERSLSPRRRSAPSNRDRAHSPQHSRRPLSPRRNHTDNPPPAPHPLIPVIGRADPAVGRLPTKEEADFERDQALYAHYRQAYERDWYERGVMPPPPYDRFIHPRYSQSPPPGAAPNLLVTSQMGFPSFPPPPLLNVHPGMVEQQMTFSRPPMMTPQPSQWDDGRYGSIRPDHPRRDPYPAPMGDPGPRDFQPRYRQHPDSFDPKEEHYRMQLSPYSRRKYEMDRQSRGHRSQHRDATRYAGSDRRSHDDYLSRKRAREQQRESSPSRGSFGRSKRSRPSPVAHLDEGDATPVRDERPPPDEMLDKRPPTTRKAGDLTKVGKKPRRDRKAESGDRSRSRRSTSPSKRDSKSSSSRPSKSGSSSSKQQKSKSDRGSKSESTKSKKTTTATESKESEKRSGEDKNKPEVQREDKNKPEAQREEAKDAEEVLPPDVASKEEKSPEEELVKAVEEVKSEPATSTEVAKEPPEEEKASGEKEKKETSKSAKKEKTSKEKTRDKEDDVPKKVVPSKKSSSEVDRTSATKSVEKDAKEETKSTPKREDAKKDRQQTADDQEKPVEKKKEKQSKVIKLVRDQQSKPTADKASKQQGKAETNSKKTVKTKRSVTTKAVAPGKSGSTPGDRTGSGPKLVEYDGTGPPPAGDELVKITIPKSKWEESDEENKQGGEKVESKDPPQSRRVVKTSEAKPIKGRRIRIKRKSPVPPPPSKSKPEPEKKFHSLEPPGELAKSAIQDTLKKMALPAKEPISDARMVITLRRNSRQQEEQGRRVSMGNPDEASFEPDYSDPAISDEQDVEEKSPRSSVIRTMSKNRKQQEDPDTLGLSDYSNFSNGESEKSKKSSKKKKKKKKKRKIRSQIIEGADSESRKKSSRSYDESPSAEDGSDSERRPRDVVDDRKRRHRESSVDDRAHRKELKKKRREQSRDQSRRSHDDAAARSRDRRHEREQARSRRDVARRGSRDRSQEYERSRDKKRKKEKRQKHRRRRESSALSSDRVSEAQ